MPRARVQRSVQKRGERVKEKVKEEGGSLTVPVEGGKKGSKDFAVSLQGTKNL